MAIRAWVVSRWGYISLPLLAPSFFSEARLNPTVAVAFFPRPPFPGSCEYLRTVRASDTLPLLILGKRSETEPFFLCRVLQAPG